MQQNTTYINMAVLVKKPLIPVFKVAIQEEQRRVKETEGDYWFAYYDDIELAEDGSLYFDDYNRKWVDEEDFYEFIARYAKAKSYIIGYGETYGDYWKIEFNGKGNWQRFVTKWIKAED